MVASAAWQDRARLDHGDARKRAKLNSLLAAGDLEPLLARLRMAAEVLAQVDRSCPRLLRNPQRLLDRIALANKQSGAAFAQRSVEIAQTVEQMRDTIRGSARASQESLIEHEERQDAVSLADSRGQRRVVTDAEVSSEENEDAVQPAQG